MLQRKTVNRGYVTVNGDLQRTLVDDAGRVYLNGQWAHHDGQVTRIRGEYQRWKDVPAGWMGSVPFW